MPVVLVMDMTMRMRHRQMGVPVVVAFLQMQPNARTHQDSRQPERP